MDSRETLLVLGLGNVLCRDDGLGVRAVERLERDWQAPRGVRVLDGGTLGLALLAQFQQADRVILVDAIEAEAEPGSLVRLEGDDVEPAVRRRLSVHQVGVADLLDGLRLLDEYPEQLVLLGLVPHSMELDVELSPSVEARLGELVEVIVKEADRLGFRFRPRDRDAVDPPAAGAPAAGVARVVVARGL